MSQNGHLMAAVEHPPLLSWHSPKPVGAGGSQCHMSTSELAHALLNSLHSLVRRDLNVTVACGGAA